MEIPKIPEKSTDGYMCLDKAFKISITMNIVDGLKSFNVSRSIKLENEFKPMQYTYIQDNDDDEYIYEKTYNYNYSEKIIFNTKENIVIYTDSCGHVIYVGFNEFGTKSYWKDNTGFIEHREFDSEGRDIHYKNSLNYEYWKKYDEDGNFTYVD